VPYDFKLSETQRLFQHEAARAVAELIPFDLARIAIDHGLDHVVEPWQRLADLGYAGVCAAEQDGGSDLGVTELVLLAEQAGTRAAPLPLVWHNVALRAISRGSGSLRPGLAAELASGRQIVTVAHMETADATDAQAVAARLTQRGDRFHLNAEKRFVPFASIAAFLLVTARLDDGYALVLVPAVSAGVRTYRSHGRDGRANV
jgi:3-oxocholest-4-en-26-oyl-CoA dehydrogenase beta subunit